MGGAARQRRARDAPGRPLARGGRGLSADEERIPLAKPIIGDRERELVDEVLRSGQLSLGPMVPRFERAWAERIGVKHAVAVSSGTAGLHLCLHALGLGPGDEVITSSFSFVASANAILFTGATPVFAEVDPLTFNMDPAAVEAAITPRTKAILIVDIFGYPAEVPALVEIARAARPGAGRGRLPVDRRGARRPQARHLRAPGRVRLLRQQAAHHRRGRGRPHRRRRAREGALEPAQPGALRRRRVAGPLAARLQLPPLRRAQRHRRRPARAPRPTCWRAARGWPAGTRRACAEIDGVTPMYEGPQKRSWFVYAPRLDAEFDRDEVIGGLDELGISAKPYLPCIHLQPYYQDEHGHGPGEFPVTEAISALHHRAALLPGDDRGAGGPASASALGRRPRAMSEEIRLWGGRFGSRTGGRLRPSQLLAVGRPAPLAAGRAASRAHARMLGAQGIIPAEDAAAIDAGLAQDRAASWSAGEFVFRAGRRGHPHRRRAPADRAGGRRRAAAAHARSRNDQVITDTLLYLRAHATAQIEGAARTGRGAAVPGRGAPRHPAARLHPQPARPAGAARAPPARLRLDARPRPHPARPRHRRHGRVPARLRARSRASASRSTARRTAAELGFARPSPNSLDAVGSRDALVDYLHFAAQLGVHLSRLGAEIVTWAGDETGFVDARRRLHLGLVDAPAEEEPRRRRAGPRQGAAPAPPTSPACSGRWPACRWRTTRICRRTRSTCSTRSTRSSCCCRPCGDDRDGPLPRRPHGGGRHGRIPRRHRPRRPPRRPGLAVPARPRGRRPPGARRSTSAASGWRTPSPPSSPAPGSRACDVPIAHRRGLGRGQGGARRHRPRGGGGPARAKPAPGWRPGEHRGHIGPPGRPPARRRLLRAPRRPRSRPT